MSGKVNRDEAISGTGRAREARKGDHPAGSCGGILRRDQPEDGTTRGAPVARLKWVHWNIAKPVWTRGRQRANLDPL